MAPIPHSKAGVEHWVGNTGTSRTINFLKMLSESIVSNRCVPQCPVPEGKCSEHPVFVCLWVLHMRCFPLHLS